MISFFGKLSDLVNDLDHIKSDLTRLCVHAFYAQNATLVNCKTATVRVDILICTHSLSKVLSGLEGSEPPLH